MTEEPNEPFTLNKEELKIIQYDNLLEKYGGTFKIIYDLSKIEDAERLVKLLNTEVKYSENLGKHYSEEHSKLNTMIETIKETSNHKTEAINTITNVYELMSKETDFNTQIIALIKLDCIKEIKKQYGIYAFDVPDGYFAKPVLDKLPKICFSTTMYSIQFPWSRQKYKTPDPNNISVERGLL